VSSNTAVLWSVIISGVLAVVGLGGLAVAIWTGRRDRIHDRTVRWEQRRQERLEVAYVTILEYINNRIESEAAKWPTLGASPTDLPPPDHSEIGRARALAAAHASEPVRRLLDEFFAAFRKIRENDLERRALDKAGDPARTATEAEIEHYAELLNYSQGGAVPILRAIEERLHDQVRHELLE
jgi:hypothetical protein